MHITIVRSLIAAGLASAAIPTMAQTVDHSAHAGHSAAKPMDHPGQDMNHADHMAAMNQDISGAQAALIAYRRALTERDADAMTALFADESRVFENGKAEGSFTHYMEHHLGPELGEITSFTFREPTVEIIRMGHMAYGRETYTYRIELADGRVIEREGVATSVLVHDAEGWKIVQYHSSSRSPRG